MSEIPFVNRLGDEIEQAAAARIAARRSRIRRRLTIGALSFAIAATGVAAASGVFNSPEQLAANAVGCYDQPSFDGGATVLTTGEDSPVETCRRVLHTDGPLTACTAPEHVAVFPAGAGVCHKLGLAAVPAGYASARAKVNALSRDVAAIEESADCIPPQELARRVEALLDRTPGWAGWRTTIRTDLDHGPCGTVRNVGGDGSKAIEGSLDTQEHVVTIWLGPSQSTMDLLADPQGPTNRLLDASGSRCYTVADLHELAHDRLDGTGKPLSFIDTPAMQDVEIAGARGQRLKEGCAVIVGVGPDKEDRGLVVELWH